MERRVASAQQKPEVEKKVEKRKENRGSGEDGVAWSSVLSKILEAGGYKEEASKYKKRGWPSRTMSPCNTGLSVQ